MDIISLFSGCGGLDLGFKQAGFNIIWANEFDKTIFKTFEYNFPNTIMDKNDISNISSSNIPYSQGIIGGPPCQSFSEAGSRKGIADDRGKLFYEYIRILKDKQPLFFLAENVSGILHKRHQQAFFDILNKFRECNYNISFKLLNAKDFGIAQDRKRVFIIGFHKKLNKHFIFPKNHHYVFNSLKNVIYDLQDIIVCAVNNNKHNPKVKIANHEYMNGSFSSIYMSRNRVRSWDEVSFTIQAGSRHAPIHPQAPKMIKILKDKFKFVEGKQHLYRRLSVRECARIQTFPDNFIFFYDSISDGYKMVGNAVPISLAKILAKEIKDQIN